MSVIDFPVKQGKRKIDFIHRYKFRASYHFEYYCFGAQIAKNLPGNKTKIIAHIVGYETEKEAEAAADGFIQALEYVNDKGEL